MTHRVQPAAAIAVACVVTVATIATPIHGDDEHSRLGERTSRTLRAGQDTPERYTARVRATNGRTVDVEIAIARWTTAAERVALWDTIETRDARDLGTILAEQPEHGVIVVGDSRYALRAAWPMRQRLSRRAVLLTDRPIAEVTADDDSSFQFSRIDIETSLVDPPTGTIRGAIELTIDPDGTFRVGQLSGAPTPLVDLREQD